MCGIAGYISLKNAPVYRETIARMVAAIKHRGPDAQTVHLDGPVGFGHARLSIIDLAGGQQPLFNEDRTVSVICNGEIYNYRELRERLLQRGHRFHTGSDCEVIAHLWEEHGSKLVDELRGMFAFVLYDRRQNVVFGARDRFGQKPLYYYHSDDTFAFASEIKGLLPLSEISRNLDPFAVDQFLFHQFIPQPRTLFRYVKKLPAGNCFELRLPPLPHQAAQRLAEELTSAGVTAPPQAATRQNGLEKSSSSRGAHFFTWRYWHPTFAPDWAKSDAEHLNCVEASLTDAVESHMVADVPVGVFLSGGIDSSLITALAAKFNPQPLETFAISFPGSEHDEGPSAAAVAKYLGTKHHEFPFVPGDMRELLTRAATLYDQPLADTAVLPLMALSRAAANHVKVVLTGDGGDELFAGYRKYQRVSGVPGRYRWLSRISALLFPMHELAACRPDPLGLRKARARVAMVIAPTCRSDYNRQGWEGWERYAIYRPEIAQMIGGQFESLRRPCDLELGKLSPLNAALQLDQGTVLADRLLLKGDCSTMAFGLEARAPLLDHHLAKIAGELPYHLKVTPSKTKVALREIASRYLPVEIINRRKKGFSMPLDKWFRNELLDWTKSCLLDDSIALSRYFQRAPIEKLIREHVAGQNHAARIHTLLMFELWNREYAS
ncbi:asparagine synthase (glutamine-hydrolyzing) [Schlesneria paludicola]|uniref:asparagine synthase (glutamine-hydrolyzing) n=1 Tax=Schlesneria paludicola TaxID=360056 RepID=UPI00029A9EC5|nr:asparagine synthase (glutamine-hydrolyzing) [Schlesneria paludicola]